jgi:chromosome transmission fidelity protein 18
VRAATVGMKETETSLQVVWKDIFTPLGSKRAKDLGMTEDEEARYVQRLARLVEGSEAIEKVALGTVKQFDYVSCKCSNTLNRMF